MIGHAVGVLRRGSSSSHTKASTFGKSSGSTSSSPLLASSSLTKRTTKLIDQRRNQSSYSPALHPTAPASAAAATAETTASSESGTPYRFEPFGINQTRRSRTRLPTPLPHDLAERRNEEFKRRLREYQSHLKAGRKWRDAKSVDTLAVAGTGDLSTATLQSMNQNESVFTPSHHVENVALLRACLNTGMILRAAKIFHGIREEAYARAVELSDWSPSAETVQESGSASGSVSPPLKYSNPLDIKLYNAMLDAYLRKAWQTQDDKSKAEAFIADAWKLLNGMTKDREGRTVLPDPLPDAESFAIMAKGLVRLLRSNAISADQQDLSRLLILIRQSSYRLHDIIFSGVFSQGEGSSEYPGGNNISREGEPDAKLVMQSLSPSVAQMGHSILLNDMESVNRTLQGLDQQATEDAKVLMSAKDIQREELPELLPVTHYKKEKGAQQTGEETNFNLRVLKENLSIVEEAKLTSSDPYERQKWLEFGALDAARKRFEAEASNMEELGLSNDGSLKQKDLQRWMWVWYKKMVNVLQKDIARIKNLEEFGNLAGASNSSRGLEAQLLPFLLLLPAEKLAMVSILEIMRMQGTGGVTDGMKTASALVRIGKAIEREYHSQLIRNNPEHMAKNRNAQSVLWQGGITSLQLRKSLRDSIAEKESPIDENALGWSSNIRARVGSYLVQHLMNVATVKRSAIDRDGVNWEEDQPAFYSAYQYILGKRLGVIRLNEIVSQKLAKESTIETLHPRHLPMLVPPKPWFTYDSGGYYSVRTRVLRYKDNFEQGSYLRAASNDGSLEYIFAGLDVLGSTAWTVNNDVFKVVMQVWNSGKGIAEVPPLELGEEEPLKPDNYDSDIKARSTYLYKMKLHNLRRLSNHGQRCDVNYRLEIARAFSDEKFFFPHNMDFRGRAYPLPPHFNHMGNDLSRGLLLFAESKPLGTVGLRWLRIHLANVYGFDKASFSERENFAIDHEEDIQKVVADPLGEGNWWLNADDPWQCLATCIELVKASNYPQGPEAYPCKLPVHQDGTCNGLQHYAALGGDIAGAKQVNLSRGDRPSDVYTAVADLVIKVVERDAAQGLEAAKLVQGKITRKVVKQTVMTTVYGVTFIGAKDQVSRQLQEKGLAGESNWKCATYLAKQIMASIGDLFSGAEAIQNWLTESALMVAKSIPAERFKEMEQIKEKATMTKINQIAKEQMTSVIWTTPLGLPVVQPYRKVLRKQVTTSIQSIYIHDPYLATQVSPGKQASAFPPNFIHSLDATHMLLTALECQSAKLTFASVHDSYWTHACDIETMSDIIRDTFVRLHSCDILQKLQEEFLDRYKGHMVPIQAAKSNMAKREKRALQRAKMSQEAGGAAMVETNEDGSLTANSNLMKLIGKDLEEEEMEVVEDLAEVKVEEASDSSGLSPKFVSQFVPLKDVLPPIPQKGEFDVNEIKQSLYFFS